VEEKRGTVAFMAPCELIQRYPVASPSCEGEMAGESALFTACREQHVVAAGHGARTASAYGAESESIVEAQATSPHGVREARLLGSTRHLRKPLAKPCSTLQQTSVTHEKQPSLPGDNFQSCLYHVLEFRMKSGSVPLV
jgi:hypothetical protein